MRRSIAFCDWKARWWRDLAEQPRPDTPPEIREGIRAYALAHADAEARLATRWTQKWAPLRAKAREFMQNNPMIVLDGAEVPVAPEEDADGDEVEGNDEDSRDDNEDAPNLDPALPAAPIVELELEDEDEYADDYDFHADDF